MAGLSAWHVWLGSHHGGDQYLQGPGGPWGRVGGPTGSLPPTLLRVLYCTPLTGGAEFRAEYRFTPVPGTKKEGVPLAAANQEFALSHLSTTI